MGSGKDRLREIADSVGAIRNGLEYENWFSSEIPCQDKNIQIDKQTAVDALIKQVEKCDNCALGDSRTKSVFGEGNLNATLVFVGEAPGRDEDIAGKPFVGAAGQLLTKIIQAMNLSRDDVYITNVLHCRPPGNRNPLPEEVLSCRGYLVKLLNIIQPRVICTLGKFASQTLLDSPLSISKLRGHFHEVGKTVIMPTFHPSYLLRSPSEKKLVWQDMKQILAFLKKGQRE